MNGTRVRISRGLASTPATSLYDYVPIPSSCLGMSLLPMLSSAALVAAPHLVRLGSLARDQPCPLVHVDPGIPGGRIGTLGRGPPALSMFPPTDPLPLHRPVMFAADAGRRRPSRSLLRIRVCQARNSYHNSLFCSSTIYLPCPIPSRPRVPSGRMTFPPPPASGQYSLSRPP